MNFVEFEGKDPEDAISQAIAHFKVPPEELEIEIVSLGSSGLFGLLGGKKAKIRAALKATAQEIKPATLAAEPAGQPAPEAAGEENLAPLAQEVLATMLEKMGENCTVQGVQKVNHIQLVVEGEDVGLLIGKQGQTLEALQYLVTKIVAKQTQRKPRVIIDIESYRERHKQTLIEMALRQGEKAKRSGKPVTLNPMNAHDRRIVHLALQPDKEVKTKSRGEGLYKKIIIYPVRKKRVMEVVNDLG